MPKVIPRHHILLKLHAECSQSRSSRRPAARRLYGAASTPLHYLFAAASSARAFSLKVLVLSRVRGDVSPPPGSSLFVSFAGFVVALGLTPAPPKQGHGFGQSMSSSPKTFFGASE